MSFAFLSTSSLPVAALTALGSSGLLPTSTEPSAATSPAPNGTQAMLVFGDVDGDGLADALVLGNKGQMRLLLNGGASGFLDLTEASGLSAADGATCAVFFDADLDGDQDLFLGSGDARIWLNLGNALFEPAQSGIEHDLVDLGVVTVDTDKDGRLDLVARTEAGDLLYKNAGSGRFTRIELPGSGAATIAEGTTLDPVSDVDSAARSANGDVDAQERPATRRMNRWLALQGATASGGLTPAGGVVTPGYVPPGSSLPISLQCAVNVRDHSNGLCLRASSIPALGQLYPLTTNFNVNASGNVGIGTTAQTEKFQVLGNAKVSGAVTGYQFVSTALWPVPPMTVESDERVVNLNADLLDGFDASAFSQLGNSIESSEITNGTIAMADLGQNSALTGQVIKWNGSAWAPANDGIGTASQFLNLGVGSFIAVDSTNRIANYAWEGVWSVGPAEIVAPIHLPAGAQILSVQAYVYDAHAASNLIVDILQIDNSNGNVYSFGSPAVSFEVLAGAGGYYNQTFATTATISGTRSYHLYVRPTAAGWPAALATMAVRNIRIEWRMP